MTHAADFSSAAERAIAHLSEALAQLRTDRATPSLVENIMVDAYGSMQPVKAVASVSTADARTLVLTAWDPQLGIAIGKAIAASPLGVNPGVEGGVVRVVLPTLTEERRAALIKILAGKREEARIGLRSARDGALKRVRAEQKAGDLSEDQAKAEEKKLDEAMKAANQTIDERVDAKTKELEPA